MDVHTKNMLDHIKYLDAKSFKKLESYSNLEAVLDFMFQGQLAGFEDKDLFLNLETGWRIYDIYTANDETCFNHIDLEESNYIKEMVASEFIVSDFRLNDRNLIFRA